MKTIILTTLIILSGCSTQYATKADLQKVAQAADQNFQNQGSHIQNLLNATFKENIEKGKALNCPNGFNYLTVKCLENSK